MARATIKLRRPITDFELDIDENSVNFLWTPCSERTENGTFLVTKKQKTGELQVSIGNCYEGQWSGNGNFKDVIAWMPLPEPYREEGEE